MRDVDANGHATLSQRLARVCDEIAVDALSADTVRAAKAHMLDGIGTVLHGSNTPIADAVRRYLASAGRGTAIPAGAAEVLREQAGALGVEDEGFLWATYAFSENYGDTSLPSVGHPSTVVVPALIAAARSRPVSGAQLLVGLIAGYQVMEFLARSLNNGDPRMAHQIRGFRPTASCGAAGAAAAAACAWGLEADVVARSIEIACNYAGGLRRHGPQQDSALWVQSGEAARGGLTSLLLALAGVQGEPHMVEGDGGFFAAYRAGELDLAAVDELLLADSDGAPRAWAIDETAFKFHCVGHTLHTALDCVLDLLRDNRDLRIDDVLAIEVRVPEQHARISASRPYSPPVTMADAAERYEFSCALAVRTGDYLWPETLSGKLNDEAALRLAEAVRIEADPGLTHMFQTVPGAWPAIVVFDTAATRLEARRDVPYGHRVDAGVAETVTRKFERLAAGHLGVSARAAVVTLVDEIAAVDDFAGALAGALRDY